MTTDYRALCAELLAWAERTSAHYVAPPDVIARARAALSAPEQGPTDEEIMELMPEQLWKDLATVSQLAAHGAGPDVGPGLFRVTLNTGIVEHCRAVLTRWGRPAVEPVPVSERLPGPEDCDDQGRCWWWIVDQPGELPHWIYCQLEVLSWTNFTAWAPHWALPVPQEGADG
jgi:hypothetical protein